MVMVSDWSVVIGVVPANWNSCSHSREPWSCQRRRRSTCLARLLSSHHPSHRSIRTPEPASGTMALLFPRAGWRTELAQKFESSHRARAKLNSLCEFKSSPECAGVARPSGLVRVSLELPTARGGAHGPSCPPPGSSSATAAPMPGASGARSHSTRRVRELTPGKGAWRGFRTFRGPGYLTPLPRSNTRPSLRAN